MSDTSEEGTQVSRGMVLWRRKEAPGNKISIRLAENVPRDADLYELFREGFWIEVIDIEENPEGKYVIFGVQGSQAFAIDRDEKLLKPRKGNERALVPTVSVPLVSTDVMDTWSVVEYTDYIDRLKTASHRLQGFVRVMKRDLSLASERSWHLRGSTKHHEWLMIKEEAALLVEQVKMLEARRVHATERREVLAKAEEDKRLQRRNDQFLKVVKEMYGEEAFKELMDRAKARLPEEYP